MSKKNLEKYVDLLEQLPKNNLLDDVIDLGELGRIYTADDDELSEKEKRYRDTSNANDKAKTEYLSNLTDEEFYFLYNAFDLGKSYYTNKDSLQKDINHFGGENELIEKNLENIKKVHPTKKIGIEQITGKQDWLVIESLKGYLEKFR